MNTENIDELIKTKRLITYYLYRDAKEINITIKELSVENSISFRNEAIGKFFNINSKEPLLCYAINEPFKSKSFPDQWGIVGELLEVPNNILVFFDGYRDNHVIEIKSIQDFGRLVEETIIFDYYITNQNLDYLIAWSASEQILIGAGQAKEWVENLIKRHKTK